PLAVGQGAGLDLRAVRQAHEGEQTRGLVAAARVVVAERGAVHDVLPAGDAMMDVKAGDHVVERGELLEQANLLERAGDAVTDAAMRRQAGEVGAIERDR